MKWTRKFLLAAVLAAAPIGVVVGVAGADEGKCDGKKSYLNGKCTYCEWGGACGACQIKGCVPGVAPVVEG